MFLCLGIPCLAQGGGFGGGPVTDDHDDTAPVQVGYAVVTPSSSATGLTVLETFGLKDGTEVNQAGFLPPELVTNATMFVDVSDRLARNLGVAIVNPGSGATSVTLTLKKSDGTQLGTRTITVQARHQTAQFVTGLIPVANSGGGSIGGGPTTVFVEYTGTLSITSTTPVSVLGIRFRGANFSTTQVTNLSTTTLLPIISSGVGGANAVLLPQFAANGGWATQIVVSNSNTTSATIRIDLFKQDGSALTARMNGTSSSSFTNLIVPAGGVLVLAPRDANGDDRF
jgi:hypothetical protein